VAPDENVPSGYGTVAPAQGSGRVPLAAMAYQQPLEPDELDQRAGQSTEDVAPSGDPLEPESASPATGSSPWLVVGLVLLAVFAALLVYAVVLPAVT
jgi:hypothetical protein